MMSRHILLLPDLGLDNQPATVSVWLLKLGSRVVEGEHVVEVHAGPATVDLPSPATGILVEKLVEEDVPIRAGQPLAVIESA